MDAVASLDALAQRAARGEAVLAGCLSGTSADGIDVALVRFEDGPSRAPRQLAFRTVPFADGLRRRLRAILDDPEPHLTPAEFAYLDRDLGCAFGRAVRAVAEEAGERVDLVGSHGQTLWHHDGVREEGPASLQLGAGAQVAASAGAVCVCDFRAMDLALGGEGAPLSALVDPVLFGGAFAGGSERIALLNLGGIANLTLFGAGEPTRAFDTGPAGSLLDGLARRLLGAERDGGGAVAARGRPDAALLAHLQGHPFFAVAPPKSTGRDTFGVTFVDELLARAGGSAPETVLATAVELVAGSVGAALERFARPRPTRLVLCGGGVHNRALVRALARVTGLPPATTAELGVDPDAREALVFATLALWSVLGRPATEPGVTGAGWGGVLGALHRAPLRGGHAAEDPPLPEFR